MRDEVNDRPFSCPTINQINYTRLSAMLVLTPADS
jgi:hypothetical protein